jgi:hypothetical protein
MPLRRRGILANEFLVDMEDDSSAPEETVILTVSGENLPGPHR